MRSISIFGVTGSIGQNTVDLIRRRPNDFRTEVLTGGQNISLLAKDAIELGARQAVTADPALYGALKDMLAGTGISVSAGPDAIAEAACVNVDWTMSAIVGAAGLVPSLKTVEDGRTDDPPQRQSFAECLRSQWLCEFRRRHGRSGYPGLHRAEVTGRFPSLRFGRKA